MSIGNANDEAIQISLSSDVTIQHTLLAETLGDHVEFGGMLLNYSDPVRGFPLTRLSIHHNMWNRIFGRLPELSRENIPSAAGSTMDLDLTNNVAYDPRRPMLVNHGSGVNSDPAGPSIYYNLNLVGNYFFGAPAFDHGMLTFVGPPVGSETRMFFQDNRINRFPTVQDYQLIYCCNGFGQAVANGEVDYPNPAAPPFFAQSTRHPFPPITTQPSGPSLLDFLLARVGARPRDAMDTRLLARVSARTFESAPLDQNPAGDALAVNPSPPAAPLDTDGDGMPDSWEIANGLDPNVPDNNGTGLSVPLTGVSGYTNIEVYLNQLADSLIP